MLEILKGVIRHIEPVTWTIAFLLLVYCLIVAYC